MQLLFINTQLFQASRRTASKQNSMLVKVSLAVVSLFICFGAMAKAVNMPAPDFTLASKEHGNIRLQEQLGNVVLINFWASWCAPCREELPHLEAIQQEYADLGFTVLGVNVEEDSSKADTLLNDIAVTFPVLFDPTSKVSGLYKVDSMPFTVLIDRDGNQRLLHRGYKTGEEKKYQVAVKALLRE